MSVSPSRRRRRAFRSVPLLLLATGAAAQAPTAAEARITADGLAADVRFLASDLLEGRGVGTRGDQLARAYLAAEFAKYGLRPAGADGGFEQPVPIVGLSLAVTQELTAEGAGGRAAFTAPDDYTAVAGGLAAEPAWTSAPLVFVGYGITAEEYRWDDFKGADLRGKVLLIMNNDPAGDPQLFAGRTRLWYGRWDYKYEEAARHGAIGAIVIHTTESAGYPFQVVQSNHGRENCWLPATAAGPGLRIRSWCTEAAARRLCGLGGKDLDALRAAAERRDFAPVDLGVQVSLAGKVTQRELQSANVLATLPGADPELRDQWVVVTAHFDHLGRGTPRRGDDIYNGAVDNASGCAAMLAVVRACAALPQPPRRTLLFAAVTAEESGLLGSEWLAKHPPVPARQLVADFNLDSMNVWGPTHDIEFVGHGKSDLTALVAEVAAARGRRLEPDATPENGTFYRSDHFNFARIGVPSVYLKGGNDFVDQPEERRRMKNSFTAVHYHQPTDQLAPWWNLQGAVDDTRLLFACLLRTADRQAAPQWTPGDEFARFR